MTRRVEDSSYLFISETKQKDLEFFCLAFYESNETSDTAQLLITI
jgi:hypothetical protein